MKNVFCTNKLNMLGVAKSFALDTLPKVDLPGINALKDRKRHKPNHRQSTRRT